MAKEKNPAAKSPISPEQFAASAKPLLIDIDGSKLSAAPKTFSTGSLGWFAGEKITVMVDGLPLKVQVGLNLIIVGSKPEAAE